MFQIKVSTWKSKHNNNVISEISLARPFSPLTLLYTSTLFQCVWSCKVGMLANRFSISNPRSVPDARTLNCVWSGVVLSRELIVFSLYISSLRLAELISVSPHVTSSRIALWRKIYCSCIHNNTYTSLPHEFPFTRTHRSLHHLHALVPHLVDGSCNVHHLLLLDLLQDIVNADEGTSTTNTSTA